MIALCRIMLFEWSYLETSLSFHSIEFNFDGPIIQSCL
jgi:hypothetical protein